MTTKVRTVLAVFFMAALLTGCRSEGMALRDAKTISVVRPGEMDRVALPVRLQWRANGIRPNPDLRGAGPFFAIFVDRPPVAAGTGLRKLLDEDCRTRPGCPDQAWLADHNVYVTGKPEVTLSRIKAVTGSRVGADNSHRATIVLIDGDGVRVDESAASVEFQVVES
ncbi:MAG: hypothetical protein QOE35_1228 [Actinomycetota bacterium]